jgi:carbonic anhydrase
MGKFSVYEYRRQPGFDMNTFEGANQAIPMKTLVIYCFDPRAADIPQAVAAYLGDEVYRDQRGWTRRLRSRVRGGHGLSF